MGNSVQPPVENLTVDDIRSGLESGSILLVDVREDYEFEAGHIPGSVLVGPAVSDGCGHGL